jgi:uncharacterized protein YcbX
MPSTRIEELWIYPIKACRGLRVQRARVCASGFELDREFCVVDLDGAIVSRCEAISQRKLPALATVEVSISADGAVLLLNAPGMPQAEVPIAHEVEVQASGVSTTSDGGWWLGATTAKQCSSASAWFTTYLNREVQSPDRPGLRVSGKTSASAFALCRCLGRGIEMASYPPEFPILEHAATDPRFAGNARKFSDFAPFLLVNQTSADEVGRLISGSRAPSGPAAYPIGVFRGNLVVRASTPWAEETWARVTIRSSADGTPLLSLRKIKECPRCTVPCRDGRSGAWLYTEEKLKLWKVLKKAFPAKFSDPQWGTWAGAFFGVYFGHGGALGATLHVGDAIEVVETTSWDAHLRGSRLHAVRRQAWLLVVLLAAVAAAVLAYRR